MKNAPCFHCNKRTEVCHSTCKEYLAFAEDCKAERSATLKKLPLFDYSRAEKRKQERKKQ